MKALSEEIKERVIAARAEGKAYQEIADELGVSRGFVAKTLNNAGVTQKRENKTGKKCPKCHRGGFPTEYVFCPFCQTDMRSKKEFCIERLERAKKLIPPPHDEKASQVVYAIISAIEYLKHN